MSLFDAAKLAELFLAVVGADTTATVYGEAYGGKMQAMSAVYGPALRFVAFEVQIGDAWLDLPNALDVVLKLGLEFVPYRKVPATIEALDVERNRPSEIAERLGLGNDKHREGIVVRPLVELRKGNGDRIIAKHKAAAGWKMPEKRKP